MIAKLPVPDFWAVVVCIVLAAGAILYALIRAGRDENGPDL